MNRSPRSGGRSPRPSKNPNDAAKLVVTVVDYRGDAANVAARTAGYEQLGLGVLEEGILSRDRTFRTSPPSGATQSDRRGRWCEGHGETGGGRRRHETEIPHDARRILLVPRICSRHPATKTPLLA